MWLNTKNLEEKKTSRYFLQNQKEEDEDADMATPLKTRGDTEDTHGRTRIGMEAQCQTLGKVKPGSLKGPAYSIWNSEIGSLRLLNDENHVIFVPRVAIIVWLVRRLWACSFMWTCTWAFSCTTKNAHYVSQRAINSWMEIVQMYGGVCLLKRVALSS